MYDEDGIFIAPVPRAGLIGANLYDTDAVSRETGLTCPEGDDYTQQQFKEECDINEIVRRFGLTGQLPDDVRTPVSGDFTGVKDYQTAMNAVRKAQEDFMDLPAHIRAEFDNDPQKLMNFMENDKNRARAEELGLINKPPEVPRDMVKAIDELSAKFPTPEVKK